MRITQSDVDYAIELAKITLNLAWKKMSTRFLDFDALESAAYYGAWQALETYDPSRGASLKTWIINRVRFAIGREVQENTPAGKYYDSKFRKMEKAGLEIPEWGKAPLSLYEPAFGDDEEGTLLDSLPDPETPIEEMVTETQPIEAALAKLTPRLRDMVVSFYYTGETYVEIGKRYGITKPSVDSALRTARGQLRRHLLEAGYEPD